MKVRATKLGYYGLLRRYPGDVFEIKEVHGLDKFEGKPIVRSVEQQFSPRWMVKVSEKLEAVEEKAVAKGRTRAQVQRAESSTGDMDVI